MKIRHEDRCLISVSDLTALRSSQGGPLGLPRVFKFDSGPVEEPQKKHNFALASIGLAHATVVAAEIKQRYI